MSAVPVALPVMFTVSSALGSMDLSLKLVQAEPGFGEDDVIEVAALASNEANEDPIDLAFLRAAVAKQASVATRTLSFQPFSATTRRTEAVKAFGGRTVRCVQGALRTVAQAADRSPQDINELEERANAEARKGERVLAVAKADGAAPLQLVGLAYLYDAPRPDSRSLIDALRRLGIQVNACCTRDCEMAEKTLLAVTLAYDHDVRDCFLGPPLHLSHGRRLGHRTKRGAQRPTWRQPSDT
ncbi:Plasma membrane ATPase [Cupriavidus basilensis]|uniref:Plasma membrane ATPase n=1 Tax=Cupriavidus basilensis TaxID=68895 RepID=A0A0C4YFT6_9BURK|nr:Plasma membrane ATPase [Cupriavidus basilensis]